MHRRAQERSNALWANTAYVVPTTTRPVFLLVADAIRGYMIRGELAPGVGLPSEIRLAEHFGVSRSTVREALRVLSTQGLIVTKRGRKGGSTVAGAIDPERSEITQADLGLLGSELDVSPGMLIEARAFVEVQAARFAATRRTEAQLLTLKRILSEPPNERNRQKSFQFHSDFHQTIYEACGNPLVETIAYPLLIFTRRRYPDVPPDFAKHAHEEHVAIYEAIADGDVTVAGEAMRTHLAKLTYRYAPVDRASRLRNVSK